MAILVTLGPTQEPLDAMRILSNRSTGELGTLLARSLADAGFDVVALRGVGSTFPTSRLAHPRIEVVSFSSAGSLQGLLEGLSSTEGIEAVFHAAAVSDFYLPGASGGKLPSEGPLTLSLSPTPKILPLLRGWFSQAYLVGWKFEASVSRDEALSVGLRQMASCRTNACAVNGPSYGEGFGLLLDSGESLHFPDKRSLGAFLAQALVSRRQ